MGTSNRILRKIMSDANGKIVEGVFAINKPPSISSAGVIRNLQHRFNPSKLFEPWIDAERYRRQHENDRHGRRKKQNKRVDVKIGHGGTLDPMATGVLIMGVGKGTKHLQSFLECTKTYEATVLFGAATDTYDTRGKVLRRGPYKGLTKERLEEALKQYRGKIMQRPPLYSALRVDGKRLYEYAREGKEVPREIEKRPVEVKELEIVEWLEGGAHQYRIPEEEAEAESKELAEKVLHFNNFMAPSESEAVLTVDSTEAVSGIKRKRLLDDSEEAPVVKNLSARQRQTSDPDILMSGALHLEEKKAEPSAPKHANQAINALPSVSQEALKPRDDGPPAVKLRMTVTSGFYVRSLSHDLGEAIGSLACMSALVRSRQGKFELGQNVLEYEDVEMGEEVWGPKVEGLLDDWKRDQDDKA